MNAPRINLRLISSSPDQGTEEQPAEEKKGRLGGGRPIGRRSTSFIALLALVLALNVFGLAMVLSASSVTSLYDGRSTWFHFQRQVMWFGLGVLAMVIAMRIDYRRLRVLAVPGLFLSVALLIVVLIPGLGVTANGASRWIGLGPFQVQPSELAKLALILFAADLLARRYERGMIGDPRLTMRPILTVLVILGALILVQPNLGTVIILGTIAFMVMFIAGVRLPPLAAWGLIGGLLAVWLALSEGYRRDRIFAFLDPWEDPLNSGYQTIQSLVGIAEGGVGGVGLGAGRAKWGYLPFAHTDFIFAVIAEELGLVGGMVIVAMFVLLAVFGIRVAMRAPDRFGMLLAVGITAWLFTQAFINIGAVVGILPITGVPLPFVSAGGSSLLVGMAAIGILLNVARQERAPT